MRIARHQVKRTEIDEYLCILCEDFDIYLMIRREQSVERSQNNLVLTNQEVSTKKKKKEMF